MPLPSSSSLTHYSCLTHFILSFFCVSQAAYEVEPASYAMALRTFKTEPLTGEQAMNKLREGINREILVRFSPKLDHA